VWLRDAKFSPPPFLKKLRGPTFLKTANPSFAGVRSPGLDKELSILVDKFDTMPTPLLKRHANLALLSLE
jgi:hypothetical protein